MAEDTRARSRAWLAAARCLQIDQWTAEVVTALRAAGVRPVLVKGPATARWLYPDDPHARAYVDVDLMVAPGELGRAEEVVGRLGFVNREFAGFHARAWQRPDGAWVDLHRTLHGCEGVPAERVWAAVTEATERIEVGGVDVEVPGEAVRTLHLVLHLGPNDQPGWQAWTDLERGLRRLPRSTWARAAELARSLGVDAEMGVKLRRAEAGRGLADELGLPTAPPEHLLLHDESPQAYFLDRLGTLPGWRARAQSVLQRLVPSPSYMRASMPVARSGPLGLALAYAIRVAQLPARVWAGVTGWLRVRRRLRRP